MPGLCKLGSSGKVALEEVVFISTGCICKRVLIGYWPIV